MFTIGRYRATPGKGKTHSVGVRREGAGMKIMSLKDCSYLCSEMSFITQMMRQKHVSLITFKNVFLPDDSSTKTLL